MSLHWQLIDPTEVADWNNSFPAGSTPSVFHTAEWARTLRDSYGYKPIYAVARQEDKTMGIVPLMEVSSALTGKRAVSLPFTDYCAPILPPTVSASSFVENLIDHGKKKRWRRIELRGWDVPPASMPPSLRYFGHSLDLGRDEAELFAALKPTVRTAVRKASKEGVAITFGRGTAEVRAFCALNDSTRRDHGLPPQPLRFFVSLQRHVLSSGLGFVVLGSFAGRSIAGAVFLHLGKEAVYKYGASDKRYQGLRANDLVMWEGINHCKRLECARLTFGRTELHNEGLRRFKLGWGTTEYEIQYHKYDFRKNAFVTDTDRVKGWYNAVFRAMPIPIAKLVGAMMYRHVG
jgi:lipid II:glycine glycyltransferase (peptidoglycan interpeptide bridge formation enzyme)